MSKFKRKGKSRFKRRWNPTCYVCHKPIQELHDMKRLKKEKAPIKQIEDLENNIIARVTCVGHYKSGDRILRHNNGYCEPGGSNYMKNPDLTKGHISERKRWWEDLPNVVKDTTHV